MLQLWFMGMFVTGLANKMERNISKITEHGVTIWNGGTSLIQCDASSLHGLHGREGCKAHSHSLGQASLLKYHYPSMIITQA